MKQYIGTKVVQAEPAADGYKIVYSDGYESWSPKEVFGEYEPVPCRILL